MENSSSHWEVAAQIAQVAATIITGIGIIVSIWLGRESLKEARADREDRARPYLLFEPGGYGIAVSLAPLTGIAGFNPDSIGPLIGKLAGRETYMPDKHWGRLSNFGTGAAIDSDIRFFAYRIHIGSDSFPLDEKQLRRFPYLVRFNTIPTSPSHILPHASGSVYRIPTSLIMDVERKISGFEFVMQIRCRDSWRRKHYTYQECTIWIRPDAKDRSPVHATLGDELSLEDASERLGSAASLLFEDELNW